MENERQRIIELFQTGETANIKLGLALAKSQKIDLADFFAQMEAIYRLDTGSKAAKLPKQKILEGVMQISRLSITKHLDINVLRYLVGLKIIHLDEPVDDLSPLAAHAGIRELAFLYAHLEELPPCVFQLPQIAELCVYGNKLRSLPDAVGTLLNLQTLSIHSNQLSELPEALFRCQRIERLVLAMNQFTRLPYDFSRLKRLKHLYLHENPLEEFPESLLQCTDLEMLDLGDLRLKHLPHGILRLPNLRTLTITRCGISPEAQAAFLAEAAVVAPKLKIYR